MPLRLSAPSRPRLLYALAWATVALAQVADAQENAAAPAQQPSDATAPAGQQPAEDAPKLEAAKRLFRDGNELRKRGDLVGALDMYLRSRDLVPSAANTRNAAFCLEQLARWDEAVDLYNDLLVRFGSRLSEDERAAVGEALRRLRDRVGWVTLSSNVEGVAVIDGRMRGRLPLTDPLAVVPGRHTLRVLQDGYEPFESTIEVSAAQTVRVDGKLRPLVSAGRLRIEGEALRGGDVFVDGAMVGQVPWEGTLAPGRHTVRVELGEVGTGLVQETVLAGRTVLVDAEARPLGPAIHVASEPRTAQVSMDGIGLGAGSWSGRVPVGRHFFEAREPGYRPASSVAVVPERGAAMRVLLRLEPDPDHPRWGRGAKGAFVVEGLGGIALASSLGSGAEASCSSYVCSNQSIALGSMLGVRAGYELPFQLALEAAVGYLDIRKHLTRTVEQTSGNPPLAVTYQLRDDMRLAGPFVSLGAAYRIPMSGALSAEARVHLGALFGVSRDAVHGAATARDETAAVLVVNSGEPVRSVVPMILPSLALRARFGLWTASAGLAVALSPLNGPANTHGETEVVGCDASTDPQSVKCAQGQRILAEERTYGRFVVFVPSLSFGAFW